MTRWDRRGLAAPTGFREVNGGSGLEAQVIDWRKKTPKRFSRLTAGFAVAVGCPAPVRWLIAAASSDANSRINESGGWNAVPCLIFTPERRSLTSLNQRHPRGNENRAITGPKEQHE